MRAHRLKAADALAAYARAQKPTSALLLLLVDAVAAMLATDHAASVTVLIGGVAITRDPAATRPSKMAER